jgi:hypothetical protein
VEVKNLAELSKALKEARDHLLYYNSLLADREFGDTTWWKRLLPRPFKSLIVVPSSKSLHLSSPFIVG